MNQVKIIGDEVWLIKDGKKPVYAGKKSEIGAHGRVFLINISHALDKQIVDQNRLGGYNG